MTDDAIHTPAPPRVEEVSTGIFAYIQPDGTWFLNNAGFVLGPEGVIAIDTTSTARRARALFDALRRHTDRPVQVLINTHSHGDHTWGNFVFAPATAIVAHERCREEALVSGTSAAALFPNVEWGDIRVTPPFVTFADRLTVYAGDLRLELRYFGPAHTTGDIVVWVPERKLLFSGDLIFNGGTPLALGGTIAGWLAALQELRTLGPEVIVPGHGPVCGLQAIDTVERYLRFVQDAARHGFEAGLQPLELARELDLGPFAELSDRERLVANLHRAYAELRGEPPGAPLDIGRVFADMVAYNGGTPPPCFA